MRDPHLLLLRALIEPLPQAAEFWNRWRASADIDQLDNESFCMLPALAGRMDSWIARDPYRDILRGICRRAWSQNQIRKRVLADALALLRASGAGKATAFGPLMWQQLYWPEGAIRPVDAVDLLLEPGSVRSAVGGLVRAGWSLQGNAPDWNGASFHFAPAARMKTPAGEQVRLHWHDLPNTDWALRRPAVHALSAERDLILALGGDLEGGVDWHCDALLICRRDIDWDVVDGLLTWRSRAKIRLEELRREWSVGIPPGLAVKLRRGHVERVLSAPLRFYRRAKGR